MSLYRPDIIERSGGLATDTIDLALWETNQTWTVRARDIAGVADEPSGKEFPSDAGPVSRVYMIDGAFVRVRDSRVNILATIAALAPAFSDGYVYVRDEKPDGTNGGTFTSGAWRTRDINTEVNDDAGLASISANQITLEAGTYVTFIRCPAYRIGGNACRLFDITGAAELIRGGNSFTSTSGSSDQTDTILIGQFDLLVQSALEIQHDAFSTQASNGFGTNVALSSPNTEIYTEAEFWRVTF